MMFRLLISLILLTFLGACQVEENVSSAKQLSNTSSMVPNYVVTLPTNGWKKFNDMISVAVMMPFEMTVTGTPYIDVLIGGTSKKLYYQSGSGSNVISFSYTVGSYDVDTDGVTFSNTINLNGGSLKYLAAGSIQDAPLTFQVPANSIKVDGIVPTVVSFTPPNAGNYITGNPLNYYLTFSEDVYVTGTPSFTLNMNSGAAAVDYRSGSGTKTLQFQRLVAVSDSDTTGFTSSTMLNLNSPTITIKDKAGNVFNSSIPRTITVPNTSANNIFTGTTVPAAGLGSNGDGYFNVLTGITYLKSGGVWTATTNTLINVTVPSITSVTAPAGGTYVAGNTIDFTVNWSQAVNVTGTPGILVSLTTGSVYADYVSGSGTATHTYRYTVAPGHVDFNGIVLANLIDLRGGSIKNTLGTQNAALLFTAPSTSTILVDAGLGPAVISVTTPGNGYYLNSQQIDFTVTFNQSVTVTGAPRIPMVVGSTTAYADYISGSGTNILIFRYTVATPQSDDDGISLLSPIDLNGGEIKDAAAKDSILVFSPPATPGIKVDALAPSIVSVEPQNAGNFRPGDHINFQVQFTEKVNITGTPRIPITTGATTVYANYLSGSGGSLMTFRYTVQAGELDTDGISLPSPIDLNLGTILDARSNAAVLTFPAFTSLINVDGVSSTITSVIPPANAIYGIGSNVDFIVNWNEPVQIIGNPRLQLTVGAVTVYATYHSGGSTASTSRFRYIVQENDLDVDGITLAGSVQLNGGQIKDYAGNIATLTFSALTLTNVLVDGIRPMPTLSAATPVASWYINGNTLTFNVTWPENVTIVGVPQLNLQIGAASAVASYVAGPSTPTLSVFTYTVVPGNQDLDGITVTPTLFLATGVTIKDGAGNPAKIVFSVPSFSGVKVDALDPSVANIQIPIGGVYKLYDVMDFTVTFTENVTITGSPRMLFRTNESGLDKYATYFSGSGTNVIKFRYTVAASHFDPDGITLTNPYVIDLNGGSIADAVLNLADTSSELLFVPASTSTILVDGIRPIVMNITPPASTTYLEGENLDFVFTFSDTMTVTGTPRIKLNVNGNYVWANYHSGNSSTNITFRYTVVAGNEDLDGVTLVAPIDFNGGDLQDPSTNSANPDFTGPTYSGVKVDAKAPTFISGTTDHHSYSTTRSNIDFKLTFSEPITVNVGGGTPRFPINVAGANQYATYFSGSGNSTLVFRYTLPTTETLDLDGIAVTPTIDLNGGTMSDGVGFVAPTAFTWTKKVYVYYKNILARYNFDTGNYTATTCGDKQCISSVNNIGDLTSYGSLTPPNSQNGPVLSSNFSTTAKNFAQYNDSNFLRLPSANLNNVKHVTIVMKHDADFANSNILPNLWFAYSSNYRQIRSSVPWTGRYNTTTTTGTYTYGNYYYGFYSGYHENDKFVVGGHAFYHISFNTLQTLSGSSAIGSSNFDGQLAEIIFWNQDVNLTSQQIDDIRNQLDAMYNPY